MDHQTPGAALSPLGHYDPTRLSKDAAERFARIAAAFELRYTPDRSDADVIRRSTCQIINTPQSHSQAIRVDSDCIEAFYQIKLALHIGHMPYPQVDHANLDHRDNSLGNLREATAQENGRNRRPPPRPINPDLARGVKRRGNRWAVYLRDDEGRLRYHSSYATRDEANAISREFRRKRDGAFHKATPAKYRATPPKYKATHPAYRRTSSKPSRPSPRS